MTSTKLSVPAAVARSRRATFFRILAALTVIAIGVALSMRYKPEGVQWSPDSVRAWILSWPYAPVAYVALMLFRPFFAMPSAVLMAAGGALFGAVEGTLLAAIGGSLSGLLFFWIARALGRDFVYRRFGPRLTAVDAFIRERGMWWVALYTAFPATPLTVVQAACGLSSISTAKFLIATLVGVVPRTLLLAWIGQALMEADFTSAGIAAIIVLLLIVIGWRLVRNAVAIGAQPGDKEGA